MRFDQIIECPLTLFALSALMNVVLATGIYPPDIGGPATYCRELATELYHQNEIIVITYGDREKQATWAGGWRVISVSKRGGPLLRWWRYVQALRKYGKDADIVYVFSSVSCGIPLMLSRLRKPKRFLRLGGDFLWERYTDHGGQKTLREWYDDNFFLFILARFFMGKLLRSFDYIVFSTRFQEELYENHYTKLPLHSVIENAVPAPLHIERKHQEKLRLLFMGRFVQFKNLFSLLLAMRSLEGVELTLVGDGPLAEALKRYAHKHHVGATFRPPIQATTKYELFAEHDAIILPSLTEISPNVALEAVAAGLPVLLTQENGLSEKLRGGMIVRPMRSVEEIVEAVQDVRQHYEKCSSMIGTSMRSRGWDQVCAEHTSLFQTILSSSDSSASSASSVSSSI